ncbi:MAG: hypothetical protein B7Z10_03560 [Rhodobacterales bacterium 32-66-7]|nr:MAG: hypothetical protein B7Z31_07480 [Rhodobacterales bacterium 12-65-15]OYX26332.1 MAG: hypothetical protein B7Z10_03560 [Rhodobacterales bacterium 32-66-7]
MEDRDLLCSAQLLRRAATVLSGCEAAVVRIEDLVMTLIESRTETGANTAGETGSTGPDLLALQEIDLVRQSLADIAVCLTRLADSQARNEPVDLPALLAPLHLAGLKTRLMGHIPEEPQPQTACVLF